MNYYIGDMHLGHRNSIRFDNRPFEDIEEMDKVLIDNWNARVTDRDDVFIVGDFSYRAYREPHQYLKRLKGRKHFIIGNHDQATLKDEKAKDYLWSMDKMMNITDILDGTPIQVHLSHFPIADWNACFHGGWHVYSHIHNERGPVYEFMHSRGRALNAGCMINGYMPVTFKELIENNERFWKEGLEELGDPDWVDK